LNLYKPIGPKKICSGEKDLFLNLEIKAIPNDFSVWDKIIINESKTIGQFLEYFKNKYNVELNYMSINEEEIYYKRKRKKINPLKEEYEKDLMSQKIEYIYSKKTKKDLNKIKNIFISVSGRFGNYIVKMPLIHYKIDK
jgi:ubiquitin-activating enzyme E1